MMFGKRHFIGKSVAIFMLIGLSMMTLHAGEGLLRCAGVFSSNMVLPRAVLVPVWGRSAPGAEVTVTFADRSRQVKADPFGRWTVKFDPMLADVMGRELVVTSGQEKLILTNLMVGDIWVVAGADQSPLRGGSPSESKRVSPQLPVCILPIPVEKYDVPQFDVKAQWHGLDAVEGSPHTSAVAARFAMQLQERLQVPIGIISAPAGRKMSFESMIPVEGFELVPGLEAIAKEVRAYNPHPETLREQNAAFIAAVKEWVAVAEDDLSQGRTLRTPPEKDVPRTFFSHPSVVYNSMIHPLVRLPVRGVIWCGSGPNMAEPALYDKKMEAMIRGWRTAWQSDSLPFCFVRVAMNNGKGNGSLQEIATAEERMLNENQNTAMVLSGSPEQVAERLATWALETQYGIKMAGQKE